MDQQTVAAAKSGVACAMPRWEFIALCAGADGAECAGHRHHAARPAADRRQPRRRGREPPAIRHLAPISAAWRLPAGLWPGLRPVRPARAAAVRPRRLHRGGARPRPSRRISRCCWRCASSRASARPRPASLPSPIVRDRFGGRAMAEIMSLIFMVFMIIPVIAPSIGQLVMMFAEWHMIFLSWRRSRTAITIWAVFRLPETLHPEDRRPFDIALGLPGLRHRAHQPHLALLHAGLDDRFRRAVRLHQFRPAGLCRHLRAGRLVSGRLRRHRRHDGGFVVPQLAACRHASACAGCRMAR